MSMLDRAQLISVTIDFLYELPEVGGRQIMENNEKLKAALYAVGFDTDKSITLMHDKNVRVPQDHTCYRKTTVITGTMRKDFCFKDIYLGCNILDVEQPLKEAQQSMRIRAMPTIKEDSEIFIQDPPHLLWFLLDYHCSECICEC